VLAVAPTPSDGPVATEAARALYAHDRSAAALGIALVTASPERAIVEMTVTPEMCNGFEIAHGGITFLLADSAMAFASNAAGATAVASSAEIDWLAPVRPGELLTATATLRWSSGRSSLWDVTVTDRAGNQVALMRGRTRQVGKAQDSRK
jgi:acyl-CoA thioesterase